MSNVRRASCCIGGGPGHRLGGSIQTDLDVGVGTCRMRIMVSNSGKLLMAWLLVGPPALCRAELLVQCCAHDPAESSPTAAIPSCCDEDHHGESERESPTPRAPRECGDCAGVCNGVAKPSDDSTDAYLVDWAVLSDDAGEESPPPQRTGHDFARLRLLRMAPFPPSDVPLLI